MKKQECYRDSLFIRVGVQGVIKVGIQRKKDIAVPFKTEIEMLQDIKNSF